MAFWGFCIGICVLVASSDIAMSVRKTCWHSLDDAEFDGIFIEIRETDLENCKKVCIETNMCYIVKFFKESNRCSINSGRVTYLPNRRLQPYSAHFIVSCEEYERRRGITSKSGLDTHSKEEPKSTTETQPTSGELNKPSLDESNESLIEGPRDTETEEKNSLGQTLAANNVSLETRGNADENGQKEILGLPEVEPSQELSKSTSKGVGPLSDEYVPAAGDEEDEKEITKSESQVKPPQESSKPEADGTDDQMRTGSEINSVSDATNEEGTEPQREDSASVTESILGTSSSEHGKAKIGAEMKAEGSVISQNPDTFHSSRSVHLESLKENSRKIETKNYVDSLEEINLGLEDPTLSFEPQSDQESKNRNGFLGAKIPWLFIKLDLITKSVVPVKRENHPSEVEAEANPEQNLDSQMVDGVLETERPNISPTEQIPSDKTLQGHTDEDQELIAKNTESFTTSKPSDVSEANVDSQTTEVTATDGGPNGSLADEDIPEGCSEFLDDEDLLDEDLLSF